MSILNSFKHHRYMSGGHGYHQISLILTVYEEELKKLAHSKFSRFSFRGL